MMHHLRGIDNYDICPCQDKGFTPVLIIVSGADSSPDKQLFVRILGGVWEVPGLLQVCTPNSILFFIFILISKLILI